jgi:TP53 regulating kinase-like protein
MSQKIIAQGAEAIIYKINDKVVKDRISKKYRHPELDLKLRKSRTKSEAKIINKLKSIINVPKITETKENEIIMEYIDGKKLSDCLDDLKNKNEIAEQIGQEIAKIHDSDIIHGDLTTSNMIYVEDLKSIKEISINPYKLINLNNKNRIKDNSINKGLSDINNKNNNFKVYFIDFGLGFHSERIEDKAVDLHLIRQALEAKHFKYWQSLFEHIIKGYNSKDKDKILKQLEKVESRGRYKNH